jgi:UDP-N-acetylglucosamine 2-epimerase (non-hydrolysing)
MPARILCVAGARPNFMKIGPILGAMAGEPRLRGLLVHTGQHYDEEMDAVFFRDLGIAPPIANLGVGGGSHAVQTAEVMCRLDPLMVETAPAAVLVVGDVNSTLAAALVAAKRGIPVVHVEAGLRSGDWSMPEEINRVLTDRLADLLFITERSAAANLAQEGIDPARVHFVGNVMIDAQAQCLPRALPVSTVLGCEPWGGPVGVLTLHRPSNVDDDAVLERLAGAAAEVARSMVLAFPMHPRTRKRLETLGLAARLEVAGVILLPPLGYLAMLGLLRAATLVLTDSGGLQEETTALGIPCITLRDNTERPITVEEGTNTLVGTDSRRLLDAVAEVLSGGAKRGRLPELWDGHAACRIAAVLAERFRAS